MPAGFSTEQNWKDVNNCIIIEENINICLGYGNHNNKVF